MADFKRCDSCHNEIEPGDGSPFEVRILIKRQEEAMGDVQLPEEALVDPSNPSLVIYLPDICRRCAARFAVANQGAYNDRSE